MQSGSVRRLLSALLMGSSVVGCVSSSSETPTEVDGSSWRADFMAGAERAASPSRNASADNPYGRPHPDNAPGTEQFAFLVGEHRCETLAPAGVNPSDPSERIVVPFSWVGEYIMDGRAIRDEWADVNSTGMQTRIYRPETDHWDVRWVGIGLLEGFGLRQTAGDFTAKSQPDGTIAATMAQQEYKGDLYTSIITFSEISREGFEWNLQTWRGDEAVGQASWISCERTRD